LTLLLLFFLSFHLSADDMGKSPSGVRYHGGDEILLQAFHWNIVRTNPSRWYDDLLAKVPSIVDLGVTMVWLPPPWRDDSTWEDKQKGLSGGREGYFWHSFDLNSHYGSRESLERLVAGLNEAGLKVIFDIVPNHRNYKYGTDWMGSGWEYPGPAWAVGGGDEALPFMQGDADLATGSAVVRETLASQLTELAKLGAVGFRWDFVKGFHAETVDIWMGKVLDQGFSVGELWLPDTSQDPLYTWSVKARSTVFDFALKQQINTGIAANLRYGLNANPERDWRERAVTFVDNHDTGASPPGEHGGQKHWPAPANFRDLAQVFVLISPGTPSVYWPDAFDWGRYELIRSLVKLRREAGVVAASTISFEDGVKGLAGTVYGRKAGIAFALHSDWTPDDAPEPRLEGSWGKVWLLP